MMVKFQKVTALLEQALSGIPYENLEISDELKEQVSRFAVNAFVIYICLFLNFEQVCFTCSVGCACSDSVKKSDAKRR